MFSCAYCVGVCTKNCSCGCCRPYCVWFTSHFIACIEGEYVIRKVNSGLMDLSFSVSFNGQKWFCRNSTISSA